MEIMTNLPQVRFLHEPRVRNEFYYLGSQYMIASVTHHGGTNRCTVYATCGGFWQEFEVENPSDLGGF